MNSIKTFLLASALAASSTLAFAQSSTVSPAEDPDRDGQVEQLNRGATSGGSSTATGTDTSTADPAEDTNRDGDIEQVDRSPGDGHSMGSNPTTGTVGAGGSDEAPVAGDTDTDGDVDVNTNPTR